MTVLLRILLAHSPTPGLGDYMCCVHFKAPKPSPPQSWSDCTIIPLTLSPTPTGHEASSLPGCWPLTSRSAELCSPREGRTVSKFVSLPPCSPGHLGADPVAQHQSVELGNRAEARTFQNKCIKSISHNSFIFFRGETGQNNIYSSCFTERAWTSTYLDRHVQPYSYLWHEHSPSHKSTHTLSHTLRPTCTHTCTNTEHICNFKGWIEDLEARHTVQGRAYSISLWQLLTLTYRHCITFQYCTEVCRRRTADTSKGCGKSTLLLGASQLCHSCSRVRQRGTGRGQAWLKTSADILKNGFSISHFDELKLSGQPVGRAWWFSGPAQHG